MGLEILPNELLIECFNYLAGMDIYYSFNRLNYRFQTLIRNIPLYVDFRNIEKSKFDQFCMRILTNPQMKKQIYSLQLSNENTCQIFLFLSYFSFNHFSNVRSFTLLECTKDDVLDLILMLPFLSQLSCFRLIDCRVIIQKHLPILRISQLQILTLPNLFWKNQLICDISSIISLTITFCYLDEFHQILNNAYRLKHLSVYRLNHLSVYAIKRNNDLDDDDDDKYSGRTSYAINLKQLIITQFTHRFDDLAMILQRTPNLKSLTIDVDSNRDAIDANQWQDLITSSLPYLKIFNFYFEYYSSSENYDFHGTFQHFQTDFWQKQHHWYTEYSFDDDFGQIYTIPYLPNKYSLRGNKVRHHNESINDRHTFDNVTNLTIYCDTLTDNHQYNFSHITSLSFEKSSWDLVETFLTEKHVETLKTMVNLDTVKHLCIVIYCIMETPSVLLNILKQAPNISSISIDLDSIIPLLSDNELCKYLKKMIKKLDLATYCYTDEPFSHGWRNRSHRLDRLDNSFDGFYKMNKLWETFSNIEQIKCTIDNRDPIVFLMKHLTKLSRMDIWSQKLSFSTELPHLKEEARKLNIRIITNINPPGNQVLSIWILRNIE